MKRNIFKTILLSACILQGAVHWHNKRKQNRASSHLPGSHCPNTKCPNGSATPNSAYGHTGVRNANPKPATGTVVACTKRAVLPTSGTWSITDILRIRLQGCNQRMESRKMESGEAGSPFQENRCPIFLCYGQPSRQHGLVGQ